MKNISILGVTGSIGRSALKVYDNFKTKLNIISVSANKNVAELINIIEKYNPKYAVIIDKNECFNHFGRYEARHRDTKILSGIESLDYICTDKDNNIILNAISGKAGLLPSVKILSNGIDLALANKESMVCAGSILKQLAKDNGCKIIPVDSEHSAIFHLLMDKNKANIDKIYLTASGGPFRNLDKEKWGEVTVSDALNHPTWKMGNKISIDSATMANKGLEVIETYELFDIDYDKISVLVHPQSLIHSMVEMIDGEIYAQIGPNDMAIPIQNALFYPKFLKNNYNRFDFNRAINLELQPVDLDKFAMLKYAYYCGRKKGVYPAFYNYINESLVHLFLSERIKFVDIEKYMNISLEKFEKNGSSSVGVSLENIVATENIGKNIIKEFI